MSDANAAMQQQPAYAQWITALVTERMLLPASVALTGSPFYPCHPEHIEPTAAGYFRAVARNLWRSCKVVFVGSSALECPHPDHAQPDSAA